MSNDYDITMGVNETLEIDAIIQKWNPSTNIITVNPNNNSSDYDNTGIKTHTNIFNPKDADVYTLNINDQELKVKVTDTNNTPSSGVFRWSCENENNNTTIVKDVWNDNNGNVGSATYNSTGGVNNNGSYEGNCDINVTLSGLSGSNSFSGWFYAPWSNGSGNQIVWNYESTDRSFGIHYNNRDNNAGYELLISGDSIATNISKTQEWVHIIGTYDGNGNAKVYVNGDKKNSESNLSDPIDSGTLYISESPGEGKDNNLRIADFRQYNKVLSDTEVSSLYSTGAIE